MALVFSKASKKKKKRSAIESEAAKIEKKMNAAVLNGMHSLQAEVPLGDLAALLGKADLDEILKVLDVSGMKVTFEDVAEYLNVGMISGAAVAAKELGLKVALDPGAAAIKKWLKTRAGNLIKETYGTSKEGVKATIRAGIEMGRHPSRLAKDVKASIGLTEQQSSAVMNRRGFLANKVAMGELTAEKANTLGDKYAAKMLNLRAETIARNESLAAVNEGRRSLWDQLIESGALPPTRTQEWDSALDMARCEICKAMHGQKRKVGEDFDLPDGTKVAAPPAHVQCRCVVNLMMD